MAFITAEDVFGSIEVIVFPKIYERQTQLFTEGNVILIHGRLSVREDEEAKLVCESAEPCPPADAKRKVSEQVRQASNAVTQPQKKAAKTPGLFLRFASENCPEIERAQRVLDFFDGNKTVYFYYCDTKNISVSHILTTRMSTRRCSRSSGGSSAKRMLFISMTGREDSENEEYKPAEKQQLNDRHLQIHRGVYGRRDTYDAVESFWHRSVQYGVSEFYLLRRALFLHGVGLSARRAYGMAAYGKG